MIIKFEDLPRLRDELKDKKIVYSGGTFDLLHPGHIKYFENMRKMGDVVVVAISPDESVKKRKDAARPVFREGDRLVILDSVKHIDYVLVGPNYTEDGRGGTVQCLLSLEPDIFVSGDEKWIEWVKSRNEIPLGTEVRIIPRTEGISTSEIIERITKSKER